jgi:hypothetical protein
MLSNQEAREMAEEARNAGPGRVLAEKVEAVRTFETGATRTATTAYDPSGFLSPLALKAFCKYMEKHRRQADGNLRESDNWKKGMPRREYLRSLIRHVMDVWLIMDGFPEAARDPDIHEALGGIFFNTEGLLHEYSIGRDIGARIPGGTPEGNTDAKSQGLRRP